ncbi:NAD-dependent epimerase/dehydratase family protein [Alsobacter sp. R-9]
MIVVTGGSGKLGREVVRELAENGHDVVNLDRAPPPPGAPGRFVLTDLTDFGQVIAAFASVDERTRDVTGIVHLAAIPAPGRAPNPVIFSTNTLSTYHVFEAARQLHIRNIVWASSETVYGVPFVDGAVPVRVPLDETVVRPHSAYALSKRLGEEMAEQFCNWDPSLKIVSLRYSNVLAGPDYDRVPADSDPGSKRFNLWCYIDARDGARAARLALEANLVGHHVVGIANDDSVMNTDNRELLERYFPGTPGAGDVTSHGALIDTTLAKRLLGFRSVNGWRQRGG